MVSEKQRQRSEQSKRWKRQREAEERAARTRTYSYDEVMAAYEEGRLSLMMDYKILEDRVARLTAKLNGYVNRMATEPPDKLYGEPRKGREWRKIRHRTPYIENPDGSWRRVKGQVTRHHYVAKIPPKVCASCGTLFVAKRSDARTCSAACRQALYRNKRGAE
jgi:hypothetical protein